MLNIAKLVEFMHGKEKELLKGIGIGFLSATALFFLMAVCFGGEELRDFMSEPQTTGWETFSYTKMGDLICNIVI